MSSGAENVVQNIGAIAETTSIFYNSIIKQVPKDVALILTQHFMDITISKRPSNQAAAMAAAAAAARAAEERRRAAAAQQEPKSPDTAAESSGRGAPEKCPGGENQNSTEPEGKNGADRPED